MYARVLSPVEGNRDDNGRLDGHHVRPRTGSVEVRVRVGPQERVRRRRVPNTEEQKLRARRARRELGQARLRSSGPRSRRR